MSSALRIIRYPSGATAFRLSDQPPKVGDLITTRDGAGLVVESVRDALDGTFEVILVDGRETSSSSPAAA